MLRVHSYSNGVPVFLKSAIEDYGMPDLYGWNDWLVIEDEGPSMVCEEVMDILDLKKIHRYSRLERFKTILFQLLGWRGKVDEDVFEICGLMDFNPDLMEDVWFMMKRELKYNEKSKYYNRIPRILYLMGKCKCIKVSPMKYEAILQRFTRLEYLFTLQKERKYFPSLRYTCCRLLVEQGIEHEYQVEAILTKSRRIALDAFWNKFFI